MEPRAGRIAMCGTKPFSISSLCLMLSLVLPGIVSSAHAQRQEKRIALVVGDGAYEKSPLATAANDAGLIAQTLQAAGFDVVGARDLDADTLRGSFRDFIQKAQASGPGTVAMVYLSGYGMQLAGENYFIPVDSKLSRDVDIPIEGLRISDYMRQLASLPLKASVVVLDAARQQPFIEGGQPIASGLALVEPDPHMLIAFNAAPGTVAPNEPGPYGAYAQALAEMIRTGGLPLPEVFNRIRLRVNEASKGAQVPWHAEKIDAQFMFFDRAPDAPAPAPDEVVYVDRPCLDFSDRDLGFAPPPPAPVFFLPPPPPDFVVLEPPPPPIGLFILPQPFFVPIPVYVRAPVYVAPPPNDIIFANIHNTTVINTVINRPAQVAPGAGAPPTALGTKAAPGQGGVAPAGAGPAPPAAAAQKASLIQQGKLPMPP